jgi:hypothetical protein
MQVDCNLFHAQFYNSVDFTDFWCNVIEVELYWISKYYFLGRGESPLCCVNGQSVYMRIPEFFFLAITLLCTFKMYKTKPIVIDICNISEMVVHLLSGSKSPLFFWTQMFITVFIIKVCHWNLRELVEYIPSPHTLFT